MDWTLYAAAFWSGAFICNFIPHFVKGVCGDKFPTPFAKPPGKGLSSPLVNVVWSLFNLAVGYMFFWAAGVSLRNLPLILAFFAGFAVTALMLGKNFAAKHKE